MRLGLVEGEDLDDFGWRERLFRAYSMDDRSMEDSDEVNFRYF